ncbi:MAG: V-type ATP synthase subunit E [Lachnospiraceae bacterium]
MGRRQKRLKKQLFEEVEESCQNYMKTEEYHDLLVKYIEKAVAFADAEEMTIYINPTDADKKAVSGGGDRILQLTISTEDFIGGIRAVIHERNILIDHAFKGALENEYQNFVFQGRYGQWIAKDWKDLRHQWSRHLSERQD